MILSEYFNEAVVDYKYFLEKDYPDKAVLKIISDRYGLSGIERTILFRGISKKEVSYSRKSKLAMEFELQNNILIIDGYNVLITIGAYINGNFTFIGTDGLLRDAQESHGKIIKSELLERSLILVLQYLKKLNLKKVEFYFDSPISNSKKFSDYVNTKLQEFNFTGKSQIVSSPDYILKNEDEGIISTTDSTIIDHSNLKTFDLAKNVLIHFFNPVFYVL